MESAYYLAIGVAGFLGYLILLKQRRLPAPLPPGPKGWPVLGNIDVLPSSHAWVKYSELGHQYGLLEPTTHSGVLQVSDIALSR